MTSTTTGLEVAVDNQPKKILFDTLLPWNDELDPRGKWSVHDTHRQVEQILEALADAGYCIVKEQDSIVPGDRDIPAGDFACDRPERWTMVRPYDTLITRILNKFKRKS